MVGCPGEALAPSVDGGLLPHQSLSPLDDVTQAVDEALLLGRQAELIAYLGKTRESLISVQYVSARTGCLTVRLAIYSYVYLSIHPSFHPSIHPSFSTYYPYLLLSTLLTVSEIGQTNS